MYGIDHFKSASTYYFEKKVVTASIAFWPQALHYRSGPPHDYFYRLPSRFGHKYHVPRTMLKGQGQGYVSTRLLNSKLQTLHTGPLGKTQHGRTADRG